MILQDHDPRVKTRIPSDPQIATTFDVTLRTVHAKYFSGEALTRRELLALAQAAIALAGRGE